MKYIVTTTEAGEEEIFIFPRAVYHNIMAEAVCHLKDRNHGNWKRVQRTPVAAGFVDNGVCNGRSESLGLRSRPIDSALLANSQFNQPKLHYRISRKHYD